MWSRSGEGRPVTGKHNILSVLAAIICTTVALTETKLKKKKTMRFPRVTVSTVDTLRSTARPIHQSAPVLWHHCEIRRFFSLVFFSFFILLLFFFFSCSLLFFCSSSSVRWWWLVAGGWWHVRQRRKCIYVLIWDVCQPASQTRVKEKKRENACRTRSTPPQPANGGLGQHARQIGPQEKSRASDGEKNEFDAFFGKHAN